MAKYLFKKGDKNPRFQNEYNHSLYNSHLYRVWSNMKTRCLNPKCTSFIRYGGRGIFVCKKWNTFGGFFDDMAETCKDGLTLDRIDNNGNYCKENCRWATPKEQSNNTITIDRALKITFRGMIKTISEWAKITGIKRTTIGMRIQSYKWPIELALTKGGQIG